MLWLLLPLIAAFCYALSSFIDNFSVDVYCRKLNAMCMAGIFAVLELIACVAIFIWQGGAVFEGINLPMILLFMTAATIGRIGSIPYYKALKKNDTTEVVLLSQVAPIIALVLGAIFLHQIITLWQLTAFILILSAAFLVVIGSGRRHNTEIKVSFYVLAYCCCHVVSDIIFASQAIGIGNFVTSFFWFLLGNALARLVLMAIFKSWRQDLGRLLKRNKFRKLSAISMNGLIWLIGKSAWSYGVVILPVAIMSVTGNAMQLIMTFLLGVLLTLIWPRFGRERLTKRVVLHHAAATGMVAVAVVLLG